MEGLAVLHRMQAGSTERCITGKSARRTTWKYDNKQAETNTIHWLNIGSTVDCDINI